MKKILSNHWLVSILLILSVSCILYYCFKYLDNQKNIDYSVNELINYCESENIKDDEVSFCEKLIAEKEIKIDFYTMMGDILVFNIQFFNAIAFLIIIIPTLTNLSKYLKSKYIISSCTRESYKSFLISFYSQAYRYIWILPVIASVLILVCMYNTTVDPMYTKTYGGIIWSSDIIYHPIIFVSLYLINIFLYSFTFVNISLIIIRKQHNYIKAVILSFLTYVGIELFLEVVVNVLILQLVFKTEIGFLFNIMNLFTFSDNFGTLPLMLFSVSMFLLSFIGVYFAYKNKEKFIIDCEKNN